MLPRKQVVMAPIYPHHHNRLTSSSVGIALAPIDGQGQSLLCFFGMRVSTPHAVNARRTCHVDIRDRAAPITPAQKLENLEEAVDGRNENRI